MSDSETAGTPGAVDRLAELVDAAGGDRRARRLLLSRASRVLSADAEAERRAKMAIAEAEQRARAVESDAEARIRAAEARLRVQERERAANRAEREASRAEQVETREAKAEAAAVRRARWAQYRDTVSAAAPATLSMLVYLAAVASAVFGQVSVATGRYQWALWRALLLAGFIELMALAMATTANRLRLRGERALAPRVLTWVFAGFAAGVNVWGHWSDPLMAIGLGAASLGGITLWEIRSSARHRDALRAAGQLAHPLPSLGLRFWLLQLPVAVTAYRIGIRTRVSAAAEPLVEQAMVEQAARVAARRAHRRVWPLVLAAAVAGAMLGAAGIVLSGARLPAVPDGGAAWWLGGAALAVIGVIVPAAARAARRGAGTRSLPPDARAHNSDMRAQQEMPARAAGAVPAAQQAASGCLPASDSVFVRAQHAAVLPAARAGESTRAVPASDENVRAQAGGAAPAHAVPGLSDTGEFRALTAPEHYQRDAAEERASIGPVLRAAGIAPVGAGTARAAGAAMPLPARGDAAAAVPDPTAVPAQHARATASARGDAAADARASRGTASGARERAVSPDARAPRGITSGAREQAASPAAGTDARAAAPRRIGIPDDARQWLAEQVHAGRPPSGPEIGRRFGVDPSTGRRWLNRVRGSLPPTEKAPDTAPVTDDSE